MWEHPPAAPGLGKNTPPGTVRAPRHVWSTQQIHQQCHSQNLPDHRGRNVHGHCGGPRVAASVMTPRSPPALFHAGGRWDRERSSVGGERAAPGLGAAGAARTMQPLFRVSSDRIATTSFQGCIQALSITGIKTTLQRGETREQVQQCPQIQECTRAEATAFAHSELSKLSQKMKQDSGLFRFIWDCFRTKLSNSLLRCKGKTDLDTQLPTSAAAVKIISGIVDCS